jgi:hypothetical protein
MRAGLLVLVPLLVIGVAGSIVGIGARESNAAFVLQQEHPRTIEPLQLSRAVQSAPEPVPSGKGRPATSVRCVPGDGQRRNPWRCRARYPTGKRHTYLVVVDRRGAWAGRDRTGSYNVSGCCVDVGSGA